MSKRDSVKSEAEKLKVLQFRLTNGESVLGCILEETANDVTIDGPLQIVEKTNPHTGEYNYGLKFWFPLGDDNDRAVVNKCNIVGHTLVSNKAKEVYLNTIISVYADSIKEDEVINTLKSDIVH